MSGKPAETVRRYFSGLTENTFHGQLGVVDPPMIDYVSDLLVRFVRSDVVLRIRSVTGRPLLTVSEMAAEATARLGSAKRKLHRHIGDFTLFWAGVYPEALRRDAVVSDQFHDYCSQGKRAYHLAGQMEPTVDDEIDSDVLFRLSDRFELCCYGLREVRRQWEDGDDQIIGGGVIVLN